MDSSEEEMNQSAEEQRVVENARAPKPGVGSKAVLYVLVVATILLIAQMLTTALVFMEVSEKAPEAVDNVPSGSFISVLRDFPETADIEFGAFSSNPETRNMRLRVMNGSLVSTYSFPSGGQMMIPPDFGFQLPEIQFWDELPEQYLNEGDGLTISGLNENSDYRIELIWSPSWEVIDAVDLSVPVADVVEPSGSFCGVDVEEVSVATATFCSLSGDRSPFALMIILENSTEWGSYVFADDSDDSDLMFDSGSDIVVITYRDLADDKEVDMGDMLLISGLTPGTEYTIRMIWRSTGDLLDMRTFTTHGSPNEWPAPIIWIDDVEVISSSEATVTLMTPFPFPPFGPFIPLPTIELWNEGEFGTYVYQGGTQLVRTQGTLNVDISFMDYDSDGGIDAGDQLMLSGLDSQTHYIILMIWNPTNDILDWEVFSTSNGGYPRLGGLLHIQRRRSRTHRDVGSEDRYQQHRGQR
jgi:hypothetical protein